MASKIVYHSYLSFIIQSGTFKYSIDNARAIFREIGRFAFQEVMLQLTICKFILILLSLWFRSLFAIVFPGICKKVSDIVWFCYACDLQTTYLLEWRYQDKHIDLFFHHEIVN